MADLPHVVIVADDSPTVRAVVRLQLETAGYSVLEAPPETLRYVKGVVAMAKTGIEAAGTSGSQFFVVTGDAGLPPDYALVGKVTAGQEIVDRIGVVPVGPDEQPVEPIVIESVAVAAS